MPPLPIKTERGDVNKNPNQLSLLFPPLRKTNKPQEPKTKAEFFKLLRLAKAKDPTAVRKLQNPPYNIRIWLRKGNSV